MERINLNGIVYSATNNTNNAMYIGITTKTLDKRIKQHHYYANNMDKYYFHRALKKYNFDFTWDILDTSDNYNVLCTLERYYISFFKSIGYELYNLTDGGEGLFNPTKEIRDKLSESRSGNRNPWYGKRQPNEMRKKNSKARSNNNNFGCVGSYWLRKKYKDLSKKVWRGEISYHGHRLIFGEFNTPFEADWIYKFIWEEIYGEPYE